VKPENSKPNAPTALSSSAELCGVRGTSERAPG
jgi:hypothetical protein